MDMELTTIEDCPPIQDISRFIDGLVVGEEKEILIAHLDVCPVCYETLTDTLETQQEFPYMFEEKKYADILEFKPTRKQQFFNKFKSAQKNLAYAVSASVAGIILYLTVQPQLALYSPPSAFSIASVITSEAQTMPDRPLGNAATLMSSRKVKNENIFFHLGRRLTQIEVSLYQNNRKNLEEDLEILKQLQIVPGYNKPFEELFQELWSLMSSGKNLRTKIGITDNLIEKMKDSPEMNHLRLGTWLEGIKIGLRSQPPLVHEIEAAEFFIDQLSKEKNKPKLIEELQVLNQLLSDTGNIIKTEVLINAVNKLMILY